MIGGVRKEDMGGVGEKKRKGKHNCILIKMFSKLIYLIY